MTSLRVLRAKNIEVSSKVTKKIIDLEEKS